MRLILIAVQCRNYSGVVAAKFELSSAFHDKYFFQGCVCIYSLAKMTLLNRKDLSLA